MVSVQGYCGRKDNLFERLWDVLYIFKRYLIDTYLCCILYACLFGCFMICVKCYVTYVASYYCCFYTDAYYLKWLLFSNLDYLAMIYLDSFSFYDEQYRLDKDKCGHIEDCFGW